MLLTMKEVSKKLDVSEHTIRYYDNIDLIPGVSRNEQGRRVFDEDAVGWLQFIIAFRSTGMPIADVKRYIELAYQGQQTFDERLQMLKTQMSELNDKIKHLNRQREIINTKINNYYEEAQTDQPKNKQPYQKWV
ncbi:MerR family transcriptional regulator [Furfurilactobacillus rossiae]|uniref:Transcriptional regulator n=1 Tax=Furfurilactobacillus rossiae DSM 15814 TaxID=1114972 RepID=A0A0R1RKT6_9LACO|nr:MerR family transcriptional regulator [Furfurilactobacillus rossiae]KRL57398.1 transcriptional regulator [Furfurilactobacillus rossiae DSM 15814]QFR65732.1 MerR family transcriptional regulator [Furfurilactobacillus rossiae]QLE61131.1 transcriptional regulator MerR [Furfurilactobacillus rossiae]